MRRKQMHQVRSAYHKAAPGDGKCTGNGFLSGNPFRKMTRVIALLLVFAMAVCSNGIICMAETVQEKRLAVQAEEPEDEKAEQGTEALPLWDMAEVSVPELAAALDAYDPDAARTELAAERTKDSTTYLRSDGFKETVFYSEDIRFLDEEGILTEYDPELIPLTNSMKKQGRADLSGYRFVNRTGDKKHYLPEALTEETPVRMENGAYAISFRPVTEAGEEASALGSAKPSVLDSKEPSALGSLESGTVRLVKTETEDACGFTEEKNLTAKYELDGGMEVCYESLNQGLKETLLLKEKPENNRVCFVLGLEGLWPRKNTLDEGISLYAGDDLAGSISAPFK